MIGASEPELEIVLAQGGARLRGTIVLQVGEAEASGSVYYVIVRRNSQPDASGLGFGHTDNRGSFLIRDLQPGSYRVLGFVTLDHGALASPGVLKALESFGTTVELKDGEEGTVSTTLISAEEGGRIFNLSR